MPRENKGTSVGSHNGMPDNSGKWTIAIYEQEEETQKLKRKLNSEKHIKISNHSENKEDQNVIPYGNVEWSAAPGSFWGLVSRGCNFMDIDL